MAIQLSKLVPEFLGPKKPGNNAQPGRREKAAAIVTTIRKGVGKSAILRWEFGPAGTVVIYFGVIRQDPAIAPSNQILPRLIAASQKMNFSFRLFGDGNQIGIEILSNV